MVKTCLRALACMALLLAAMPSMAQEARPARPTPAARSDSGAVRRRLVLETGSGRVLTLGSAAANVFVADPKVTEVRPASATSLFVFGVGPGRTTVVAMNQEGQAIAEYEVTVRSSTFASNEAEASVARLLSGSRIHVTPQARGLLMTGTVASAGDAARAISILRGFASEGQLIENQLSIRDAVQVTLRVRVIEMNRSVTRALGVDWQALGSIGRFAISAASTPGLGLASAATGVLSAGTRDVNAVIQALAQDNLARILAEPNLTVMSGQTASFLAGGEFPVPVAQQNNAISVEFKKYGIALAFVPTVLSDGRINLHVAPEVSQLTDNGAVRLSSGNSTLSIPALTVRRAETTVELGSGQSFAIAGLLNDSTAQTTSGLPFLGDLPIIGALFRSSGFQRQETELVILITPYIALPVSDPAALHTPSEGYSLPNDFERILLLRQTGGGSATAAPRIPGNAGFIVQ
jgi:pilus assembly protein CpaC